MEKSSLTHSTCGVAEQGERKQQEGWAEEQSTCDCDSESHSNPWSRAEARETCIHDGTKAGEEREVEVGAGRERGGEAAARAMR